MFATFSVFYGATWDKNMATDEMASITKHVWIKGLKGLTRSEIEYGLDNLTGQYAPNPDTFSGWCKKQDKGLSHNTAAYKQFEKVKAVGMSKELRKAEAEKRRAKLKEIRDKYGV